MSSNIPLILKIFFTMKTFLGDNITEKNVKLDLWKIIVKNNCIESWKIKNRSLVLYKC